MKSTTLTLPAGTMVHDLSKSINPNKPMIIQEIIFGVIAENTRLEFVSIFYVLKVSLIAVIIGSSKLGRYKLSMDLILL